MRNCQLVDILQLIAKADTAGNGRNLDIGEGLEAIKEVEERGFALNRGRYCDDDLLNFAR